MARIRSVHPDICTDEALVEVSPSAERTFVRLWTHLDDAGRCVDNRKLIKAALYPLHDNVTAEMIDDDLAELVAHGLLIRYEVDGKQVVAAKPAKWATYQKPRHPSPSKLPGPPEPVRIPTADGGNGPAVSPERYGTSCLGVGVSLSQLPQDSRIDAALDLLSERDAKKVRNQENPRAVLVTCRKQRQRDSLDELRDLAANYHDWSAIDLANRVERTAAERNVPEVKPPEPHKFCDECQDMKWVPDPDDESKVVRCPVCFPERKTA